MVRVAVTGGSGFVGGRLIEKMISLGLEVHSFGRKEVLGAIHHHWDIKDATLTEDFTQNISFDAIIHCAADTNDWSIGKQAEEQFHTNVEGTRKALGIDPAARFVYVSSASVYHTPKPKNRHSDADMALGDKFLNTYSATKAMAENIVLADRRKAGVVVLRPHAIYGKGDTSLIPRIEKAIKFGFLPLPRGGNVAISLTNVDFLTDVIIHFVTTKNYVSRIYNVSDGKPAILRDVLQDVLKARNKITRIISIPSQIAWGVGALLEFKSRLKHYLTPKKPLTHPVITRYMVSQIGFNHSLNNHPLEAELGVPLPETDVTGAASW